MNEALASYRDGPYEVAKQVREFHFDTVVFELITLVTVSSHRTPAMRAYGVKGEGRSN